MAKFRKRAPSAPKKEYSSSRKKDRRAKREKRIDVRARAEQRMRETLARINEVPVEQITKPQLKKAKKSKVDLKQAFMNAVEPTSKDIVNHELPTPITEPTIEDQLNSAFEYASDKFGHRKEYAMNLVPLLANILYGTGDSQDKANFMKDIMNHPEKYVGDYGNFEILPGVDKDYQDLFKSVRFKDIPSDLETSPYITDMLDQPWSTEESYEEHLSEADAKRYKTNMTNFGFNLKDEWLPILEQTMQSSAAWNIAKRNAKPSKNSDNTGPTALDNWYMLWMVGQDAWTNKNLDSKIWDEFVAMVEKEKPLNYIISKIDGMIYESLKK